MRNIFSAAITAKYLAKTVLFIVVTNMEPPGYVKNKSYIDKDSNNIIGSKSTVIFYKESKNTFQLHKIKGH